MNVLSLISFSVQKQKNNSPFSFISSSLNSFLPIWQIKSPVIYQRSQYDQIIIIHIIYYLVKSIINYLVKSIIKCFQLMFWFTLFKYLYRFVSSCFIMLSIETEYSKFWYTCNIHSVWLLLWIQLQIIELTLVFYVLFLGVFSFFHNLAFFYICLSFLSSLYWYYMPNYFTDLVQVICCA